MVADAWTHLYDNLRPRVADGMWRDYGDLTEVDVSKYLETETIDPIAYLYVPHKCKEGGCRLHVGFHGCTMARTQPWDERVGGGLYEDKYVRYSGYLENAAANDVVVLFPQVMPGPAVFSDHIYYEALGAFAGCWDFWGENYTGPNIMNKNSVQQQSIINMVTAMGARADDDDDDMKGDMDSWSTDLLPRVIYSATWKT